MSQRSNPASGHKQRCKAESKHKAAQQHQRIEQKDTQRRQGQYTAQQQPAVIRPECTPKPEPGHSAGSRPTCSADTAPSKWAESKKPARSPTQKNAPANAKSSGGARSKTFQILSRLRTPHPPTTELCRKTADIPALSPFGAFRRLVFDFPNINRKQCTIRCARNIIISFLCLRKSFERKIIHFCAL